MDKEREVAIEVKNISKEYLLEGNHTKDTHKKFKALNGVSFTVHKGDVVSVIGTNGSGKSTLLKILSQITKPSSGEARFHGSITSILDIGMNFHPDLTGRENIAIQLKLGKINRTEFSSYYDKIKQFSEIGDFFDQPVKFYSSGMFLRLAFSMAFHLSSDILILDEVLSVGDEGFRLKCRELLKRFTEKEKTILFVSHSRMEILELSNNCIWLDKGCVKRTGHPSEILGEYFAMHRDKFEAQQLEIQIGESHIQFQEGSDGTLDLNWNAEDAPGNDILSIHHLSVHSLSETGKMYHSDPIIVKFLIQKKQKGINIGAFFFLQDIFYQPVMVGHFLNNSGSQDFGMQLKDEAGMIETTCAIPPNFLAPGKYYLLVRFGMEENDWNSASVEAFRFSEELHFTIFPAPGYIDIIGDISKGSVRPPLDWKIKKAE